MAKTAEELKAIKEEIAALIGRIKELEPDEIAQMSAEIEDQMKDLKKEEVSVNYEEDTIPVKDKDLAQGLRNY